MSILELFCSVDDFWQQFAPNWQGSLLAAGQRQRLRPTQMHPSEMMTIVILFHQSHFRTFKAYYTQYVQRHLQSEFPTVVSYQRFVELMPALLVPLVSYLHTQLGRGTRHQLHRLHLRSRSVAPHAFINTKCVRDGLPAAKLLSGGSSASSCTGRVNDQGELLAFCLTPGNVDDRRSVPKLATRLFGKLKGSKGYLSQPLMEELLVTHGVHLITKLRNRLLEMSDKLLLRKRAIIETINDQLKNIWKTRAFAPSQPHQLLGQSGRRADRLLPLAQETFSWIATPRPFRGVAYPELTLNKLKC